MSKQTELQFSQEVVIQQINALSEEQREAIRAVLRTLLSAALCLYEGSEHDERKD
jgi:hypothetical protein